MSPSAPTSTLEEEILTFISQEGLLTPHSRPLVTVSGGRDSMFLLHLLMRHWSVAVAHFNFQLRGEESFRDEAFVTDFCHLHHIPLHLRREDTHQWCESHGVGSTQVGCRQLRYRFFDELVTQHGYTEIVTAHHADDQAETLLFRLARGTGLRGMMAMRPRNGRLVRPLLHTTREEINAWVEAHAMRYVEDSSNTTDQYTRNYIRHQLLPHFTHFNPRALQHLVAATEAVAEAQRALTTEAETQWGSLALDGAFFWEYATPLTEAHPDLARYWLREKLSHYGFSQSEIQTALDAFHTHAQTGRMLEGRAWRAIYDRGRLCVTPRETTRGSDEPIVITSETTEVEFPSSHATDRLKMQISRTHLPHFEDMRALKAYAQRGAWTAMFDAAQLRYPLSLRHWRAGDIFTPLGMKGRHKKVSDLLTDRRLPTYQRRTVWVLEDATGNIVWVVGVALSSVAALSVTSREAVVVVIDNDRGC